MNYIIDPFRNMFKFSGKSSVREFWYFYGFVWLGYFVLNIVGNRIGPEWLKYALLGVTFLPMLALGFRRLQDAGINRWYFLIPGANIYLAAMPKEEVKIDRAIPS